MEFSVIFECFEPGFLLVIPYDLQRKSKLACSGAELLILKQAPNHTKLGGNYVLVISNIGS